MMFGKKKRQTVSLYDKTEKIPTIRSSICTGEQVAGFKDPSGKFQELILIRNDQDFQEFLERYQVNESDIQQEW